MTAALATILAFPITPAQRHAWLSRQLSLRLGKPAKAVALVLWDHVNCGAGGAWPSTKRIADLAEISLRAAQMGIKALVDAKQIERIDRPGRRDGRSKSYFFRLIVPQSSSEPHGPPAVWRGDRRNTCAEMRAPIATEHKPSGSEHSGPVLSEKRGPRVVAMRPGPAPLPPEKLAPAIPGDLARKLAELRGPDWLRNWGGKIALEAVEGPRVILRASDDAARSMLQQDETLWRQAAPAAAEGAREILIVAPKTQGAGTGRRGAPDGGYDPEASRRRATREYFGGLAERGGQGGTLERLGASTGKVLRGTFPRPRGLPGGADAKKGPADGSAELRGESIVREEPDHSPPRPK